VYFINVRANIIENLNPWCLKLWVATPSDVLEVSRIVCNVVISRPPLWSEFLATDPEARVRFPALPEKKVVGLERGPLGLVSTTEELLDRKVAAPV
jgi:hypothetical protein